LLPRKPGAGSWWSGFALLLLLLDLVSLPAYSIQIRLPQAQLAGIREAVLPQAANPFSTGRPTLRVQITAGIALHELLLTPNDSLGAWATRLQPGTVAFEGMMPNLPGSWARLTRVNSTWVGVWFDGAHLYAIDTAAALATGNAQAAAANPQAPMVFRLSDVLLEKISFEGDMKWAPVSATDLPATAAAVLATRRLTVGMVADAELVALDGAATESRMLARLNIVDGIFSSQVGVRIQSGGVTLLTSANQPFTGTDPSTLLNQLRDYRGGTPAQQSSGLSHLFSGRDLDGQTVGIAYTGTLCNNRFSVSLSQARNNVTFDALIAAHEMGHVFGAPHDGEPESACASTPETFLMARTLNGSMTFSACSLEKIAPVVAAASCLAPLNAADASVGAPLAADLALNQTTPVGVTVRSNGNIAVSAVVLTIALPSGVQASAAVVTGGTCTITGAQIRCDLGTIEAGDTRAIRLDLLGTVAGNRSATLQLTAANDGLASNDRVTMLLRIAPGADLSVAMTATPAAVVVGGDTTVAIDVRNLGLAAVTDAQLNVTLPASLTLTSLTATGIACSTAAGAVSCAPSPLSSGSSATVSLSLHAVTAGDAVVSASIASTQTDPQTANNAAQQTISVTSPPPVVTPGGGGPSGGGGGGGGGSGLELLLALLLLLQQLRLRGWPAARQPRLLLK
jgi:Metallo-peptidase family M12/Domain of unknown function DUF11